MGRAKQLLPLGTSTVLARTLENVRASNVDEIVLVLGASAEAIRQPAAAPEGLKEVVNHAYAEGMASSLRAGLSALDRDCHAALIVLGDLPFVLPQTLDQIIAEYRKCQRAIVIPSYQGPTRKPGFAPPLSLS